MKKPVYSEHNHPGRRKTDAPLLPPTPTSGNGRRGKVIEITSALGGTLEQTRFQIVRDFYHRGLSVRDIQKKRCYSGLSTSDIADIIRAHSEPKQFRRAA